MKVYVGGVIGERPSIVTRTINRAVIELVNMHTAAEPENFQQPWTCAFRDGDPDELQWTLTITNKDGSTDALYVEEIEIEEEDGDVD